MQNRIFPETEKRPLGDLMHRLPLGNTGYFTDVPVTYICELSGKPAWIPVRATPLDPPQVPPLLEVSATKKYDAVTYLNTLINSKENLDTFFYLHILYVDLFDEIPHYFAKLQDEFKGLESTDKTKTIRQLLTEYSTPATIAQKLVALGKLLTLARAKNIKVDLLSDEDKDLIYPEQKAQREKEERALARDVHPLFEITIPDEQITVYDGSLTGTPLSPHQISQKFDFIYRHGLFCKKRVSPSDFKISIPDSKKINPDVEAFLEKPRNYLSIIFISQTVGYGTIANQKIPRNTIIGIYSATVLSAIQSNYTFADGLDALHVGNTTRFMSHLPELEATKKFNNKTINEANLYISSYTTKKGYNIKYFRSSVDIEEHDLVGFSYGETYFGSNPYCIFSRTDKKNVLAISSVRENNILIDEGKLLLPSITQPSKERSCRILCGL